MTMSEDIIFHGGTDYHSCECGGIMLEIGRHTFLGGVVMECQNCGKENRIELDNGTIRCGRCRADSGVKASGSIGADAALSANIGWQVKRLSRSAWIIACSADCMYGLEGKKPIEELPPRVAMQRKEMLAGLDPTKFWYNRLLALVVCSFRHQYENGKCYRCGSPAQPEDVDPDLI